MNQAKSLPFPPESSTMNATQEPPAVDAEVLQSTVVDENVLLRLLRRAGRTLAI